ncbi:MAG: hypothetical protein AUJ92_13430 [Armatimonadetes bacterium CG2_30_59_28]|nr:MAG: hypothetical protein AUJ92_13430 [Armatimonadetes bacterium CG2_30_59_28]PIU66168.1 MAG: hypothetical protein COS85_05880 [Armatimonadetes bacterium CG07_land_8_20_14_0_80_59_28]PIX41688.1 MAG: hypothetical protein COZ56_11270 [Armatimonadetes bacterium CG_4_8_14_3_um_filter_58_9]PIY37724.1 MAG: hypothetical protein COZ05_22015 [Armatimonadetes bacterium CG_4_10_14_3_um_filter_59_10]
MSERATYRGITESAINGGRAMALTVAVLHLLLLSPVRSQAQRAGRAPSQALPDPPHDSEHPPGDSGYTATGDDVMDLLWRRSDGYFHEGDYANAIRLHRVIVQFEPDFTEAYSVGAWLIESLGREKEALAFLKEGLSKNTASYHLYFEIGFFYFKRKEYADARNYFAEAIKYERPSHVDRMYAHACEKQGDLGASLEMWKSIVVANPADAVAARNLARVESKLNSTRTR